MIRVKCCRANLPGWSGSDALAVTVKIWRIASHRFVTTLGRLLSLKVFKNCRNASLKKVTRSISPDRLWGGGDGAGFGKRRNCERHRTDYQALRSA